MKKRLFFDSKQKNIEENSILKDITIIGKDIVLIGKKDGKE